MTFILHPVPLYSGTYSQAQPSSYTLSLYTLYCRPCFLKISVCFCLHAFLCHCLINTDGKIGLYTSPVCLLHTVSEENAYQPIASSAPMVWPVTQFTLTDRLLLKVFKQNPVTSLCKHALPPSSCQLGLKAPPRPEGKTWTTF